MFRNKVIYLFVTLIAILLSACAPGSPSTPPPSMTLVPDIDNPPQTVTSLPDVLTPTAIPATSTSVPGVATLPAEFEATSTSVTLGGLKPPDSDTPAAGICGEAEGDLISIVLGLGPDGIPLAGRCITTTPAQRIKLINQSNEPFSMLFAKYQVNLPIGGEMLLDEPVGQYLALGVHFLPMGPELWVKAAASVTPVVTAPPPIILYSNPVVGYQLGLPEDWHIDENGMTNSVNKEVIFSPQYAEPFVTYLSVSLDFRTLDQIIAAYAQNTPDAVREDVNFYGNPGIKFTFTNGRNEYFIPYGDQIFLIATDKPIDGAVQSILMTIQFTTPAATFEVTMADNGKTFNMKVGENLRLNLDSGFDWAVSVDNATVIDGQQGIYHARTPGSASLTAFGNPKCLNFTPPCLAPSIMLAITVIVQ